MPVCDAFIPRVPSRGAHLTYRNFPEWVQKKMYSIAVWQITKGQFTCPAPSRVPLINFPLWRAHSIQLHHLAPWRPLQTFYLEG
jgi:hypothetical protein